MNAPIVEATIKANLTDMRAKLEKGLRIAKAAEVCAGSGRTRKAWKSSLASNQSFTS
jgi:hypothetical protein